MENGTKNDADPKDDIVTLHAPPAPVSECLDVLALWCGDKGGKVIS